MKRRSFLKYLCIAVPLAAVAPAHLFKSRLPVAPPSLTEKKLIQVSGDGMDRELEKVLYKIIEKAQIEAHENGFKNLMGS